MPGKAPTQDPACCRQESLLPLPAQPQKEALLVQLMKALAHPARLRIVRVLLAQQDCIAGDLQQEVGLAASTVSQHLKQLKLAGWVQGEVDGPRRCYCIAPEVRQHFHKLVKGLL